MVVELVGLPGSGKTTTTLHITTKQPSIRSVVVQRTNRAEMLRQPISFTRQALRWGPQLTRWSSKRAGIELVKRRIRQDALIAGASRLLLLEEGVIHHVWRALYLFPHLQSEPWQPLVRGKHPLLVLELDQPSLHERVRGKVTQGPVNRELASDLPGGPHWRRATDLLEEILSQAGHHREVVRVQTSGDVRGSSDRVLQVIEGWRHR